MANIRCPTSVATECSTWAWDRRSTKHDASRSTILIARFVAPSSSAPASDVIAPPSNAAPPGGLRRLQIQKYPGYTLSASGLSSNHHEVVLAKQLSLIRSPDALKSVRYAG